MIAQLRGTVLDTSSGQVVLDVGGVGYQVLVPEGTGLELAAGEEQTFLTYLHVRDDALVLYGFSSSAQRRLFEYLLAVSGIGPKLALAAVSTLRAGRLMRAIQDQDVALLTEIPGVGKKTAQRIIVELQDRLAGDPELSQLLLADAGQENEDGQPGLDPERREEVVAALENLGYQQREIEKALEQTAAGYGDSLQTLDTAQIIRAVLSAFGAN